MQKRKALLEEKIEQLERQIGALPEGKLICTHTGPYAKWFCSDGHTKIYINKSRRPLAEKLAIKKYLQLQKEDLLHEKTAVEQYLNVANRYTPKAEGLLCGNTEFEKLLSPYFRPLSKELEEWM